MKLIDSLPRQIEGHKLRSFTLEVGRGASYSGGAVLYGHGTYPRSSVLAGQSKRVWLEKWDTAEEARAELAEVRRSLKGFRYDDLLEIGGTSYVDVESMVAHLPEEDY